MNNSVQKYALLKIQIAKLTEELNELQADVLNYVFNQEGEQLKTTYGEFKVINGRAKWKYSNELTEKEKQVKEAFKLKKREEEVKGIAEQVAAPLTLVFRANVTR